MAVKHLILGVLLEGEANGYRVCARLADLTGAGRRIESSRVYATLARLEGAGAVAARVDARAGGGTTRVFRLTPDGAREVDRWLLRPVAIAERLRRPLLARVAIAAALPEAAAAGLASDLDARRRALRGLASPAPGTPVAALASERARRRLAIEIALLEELTATTGIAAPPAVSSRPTPRCAASGSR
ncbi:MAG TPA: helix-turn-helix transcriptional regulator [Candidatus Binatia bacterium]|nr:helix-turn-helix transcriptional regulator [Candidatus Binatia bacterium]